MIISKDKLDGEEVESYFSSVCSLCVHLIAGIGHKCKAFDRIPDEIWEGRNKHTSPYPGDKGIQYKEIVRKYNPHHEPTGSSKGGQFAKAPGLSYQKVFDKQKKMSDN